MNSFFIKVYVLLFSVTAIFCSDDENKNIKHNNLGFAAKKVKPFKNYVNNTITPEDEELVLFLMGKINWQNDGVDPVGAFEKEPDIDSIIKKN